MPPRSSGSVSIPDVGHTESTVWYRVHLTVADSAGRTATTFRDVQPRKVNVTLAASPSGASLTLDGQPVAAWRNKQPLKQRRTFGTWSVPGMFSTMARDVDAVERRAAGQAKPGEVELILKAEFDPQYHVPRRYQRIEWGSRRGSDAKTATWEVKEFRVVKE